MSAAEDATRDAGDRSARADESPVAPGAARRSRGRVWLFRLLTVLIALGMLAGCEVALRLAGVGRTYELVEPVGEGTDVLAYRLNPHIDAVYFGARDMLGPETRRFDLPKPEGTYRIVFLGASTVIGFPYAPEIAFPRQVEHLLEAQRPDVDIEVLNAGITAINSFEIADLARYCAAAEPDLVVIHAGHNEFFGPGGPASSVLPLPPPLLRAMFAVRRTRIGQGIAALTPAAAAQPVDPISALPRLTDVRLGDPEFTRARDNYRKNVAVSVRELQAAGIHVVLSTVASNLRDQPPIRSVWPRDLSENAQKEISGLVDSTEALMVEGDLPAARKQLADAEAIHPEVALLQYRKGEVFLALGDFATAREAYLSARDLDGCRFRASSQFGGIVRDLARTAPSPAVTLLDVEEIVEQSSEQGIPGHDLFLEHVHYNLEGHRLLARAFAQHIHVEVLGRRWDESRALRDEQLDELLGILPEDDLAGVSFALQTVQTPPLSQGVDVARLEEHLLAKVRGLYELLPPRRREWFADLSMHDLQQDLIAGLVRESVQSGDLEEARRFAHTGTIRRPWSADAWRRLARAAGLSGGDDESRAASTEANRLEDPSRTEG